MAKKQLRKLTLEQFSKMKIAPEVLGLLSQFNGGSFMECHKKIAGQHDIWIPELVPIFQRLDAALAIQPLPRALA